MRKYVVSLSLLVSAMAAAAQVQPPTSSGAETITQTSAAASVQPNEDKSIRPFRVHVPDEAITDLRRRIRETRWPDKETVNDRSQGGQLAKMHEIVEYWGSQYDWGKAE